MGNTFFDILRFKAAYESKIFEVTRKPTKVTIDQTTAKGQKTCSLITKVLDRLRQERIDENVFLSVMFGGYAWPRVIIKGTKPWKYPYLQLLASDSGIEMFFRAHERIDKMFGSNEVADEYIKSNYPKKYESQFKNCFYEGFSIMLSTMQENGEDFLRDIWNLFMTFYAFCDLFTPAFFITHSRWETLVKIDMVTLTPEQRELKELILRYTRDLTFFCRKNKNHERYLRQARAVIAARELESVKQFSGLDRTPAERKKAWNHLI